MSWVCLIFPTVNVRDGTSQEPAELSTFTELRGPVYFSVLMVPNSTVPELSSLRCRENMGLLSWLWTDSINVGCLGTGGGQTSCSKAVFVHGGPDMKDFEELEPVKESPRIPSTSKVEKISVAASIYIEVDVPPILTLSVTTTQVAALPKAYWTESRTIGRLVICEAV